MKEYIEREAVLRIIDKYGCGNGSVLGCHSGAVDCAGSEIARIPAADVEGVVRCKDCDVPHNRWTGCPNLNGLIPPPDFYCAYGKRKIDKEE